MLKSQSWMLNAPDLHFELQQSREEGKDVSGYEERIASIQAMPTEDPDRERLSGELLDEMLLLPVMEGYRFDEPSDLEGIRRLRPASAKNWTKPAAVPDETVLLDRIYGAWLGRCAGCLLGQPIEGWRRERILGLLKETGNYPVKHYISSDIGAELRTRYDVRDEGHVYGSDKKNWINNVSYMPEDDDTNYTIIGLKVLETYGYGFTPEDVAEAWLTNLPLFHVCTAERVAYRNLAASIPPPKSASFRNVYREWIGAQIRADLFGYAAPGNPVLGAEMAWRDASISHVKNGIYGEMMVAAMLSAAAVTSELNIVLEAGLSQIPGHCRLAEEVQEVIFWKQAGVLDWKAALDSIHERYDEKRGHDWCHTVSNALIVCVALLYGELDLEKTIGIAIAGALDTDCNGATAGSIAGMMLGASKLPSSWTDPLCDTLKSGVDGFGMVKISDMARRTADLVLKKQAASQ
jgi:ADP-ribosylglycohydrolase